jgi:hypothetical protein
MLNKLKDNVEKNEWINERRLSINIFIYGDSIVCINAFVLYTITFIMHIYLYLKLWPYKLYAYRKKRQDKNLAQFKVIESNALID